MADGRGPHQARQRHMALEAQSLPKEQARQKIEERAAELVRDMPSDFWEVR